MKVTYRGHRGRITILAGHPVDVAPGGSVDVPAEVAKQLVDSGAWERTEADKPKTKKADKADEQADQGGPE